MTQKITALLFLVSIIAHAQTNTEVYLMDVSTTDGKISLGEPRNISNNEGYDNQPSFYNDNLILFSSTRNRQTDIAQYNVRDNISSWITDTPRGSEYSPLKIPGKKEFSAIRLDTNGLQRLYRYDMESGKPSLLLRDLKVGYHLWFAEDILISTVLVDDRMDLVVSNLQDNTNYTFQKNVGRSLHKIPGTKLISYISKENEVWEIKSMDPISGATQFITNIPPEIEDICWLINGTILVGMGNTLYRFHPKTDSQWSVLHTFEGKNLGSISRLATNANSSKLVLVSEVSPEIVVQKQVEAYNQRDLDAFASCYSENVLVQYFPSDTLYMGRETLRNNYQNYYENTPETGVEVIKRISIGNKVIDEEKASDMGKTQRQVAIYEVNNGLIDSMSFLFEKESDMEAEAVVQKQLDAYNARDIDAFLETYSDDIQIFDYPNKFSYQGKERMRSGYGDFFQNTPDLNCTIKNRIIIGNKVIDEEYLTVNGNNFNAVAIYEVNEGKISKVTFVR
ncbi:SnoaL-like domain-containing protein [Flavobacteriaceae bacterium TP-CH-4]|uniref:SnoaL-like domain-containing protein n=1 Tax=Pelagihabitans pacificus TaxID=2696054 RepID=A0A967AS96_9FLAO|nr:nuclear transport factor 2 family protein [Pelagihabitans pacificus]NHF59429.1 SnoaL-like domain-containing protein [Pelagihabitans pacificus]